MSTPPELKLLQRFCGDDAVLFDIGANVGYFSALMGHLGGKSSRVFSFEPSPATCEILRMNIELNGLSNVHIESLAIADEDGWSEFLELLECPARNHLIMFLDPSRPTAQTITLVATASLDSYTTRMGINIIDFLKVDVEGAEVLLIRGAKSLLQQRRVRVGLIEVCPRNLHSMGFTVGDLFQEIAFSSYVLRELRDDGLAGRRYTPTDISRESSLNAILVPS